MNIVGYTTRTSRPFDLVIFKTETGEVIAVQSEIPNNDRITLSGKESPYKFTLGELAKYARKAIRAIYEPVSIVQILHCRGVGGNSYEVITNRYKTVDILSDKNNEEYLHISSLVRRSKGLLKFGTPEELSEVSEYLRSRGLL